MKVIILAGGFGTRMSEYTDVIPKPMVTIGGMPILWHIMSTYARYGHKDFYVALGYKAHVIKDYFLNYRSLNSDFTINLVSGEITSQTPLEIDWNVTLVDTGLNSMTGGRVKRMQSYIGNETCMITYGDGVANIDINDLLKFHRSHKKMVTITAVHPAARFGELALDGDIVKKFQEKPSLTQGWINGGYFVIEPEFFNLIGNDDTILERGPLETAAEMGELIAYKHEEFWHCMDTKRDRDYLEEIWAKDQVRWKV